MDKIKEQANIVSQLLFSTETGDIYTKTLTRTWDILREIGILLWLVICLTFVGGEWFYRTSVSLGRSARTWYSGLSEKSPDVEPQSIASTGEALLDTVKSGTTYLLSQARQQLGIPAPEPITPPAPPVTPPSTPVEPPSSSGPPAPVEPSISTEPATPTATILPAAEDEDDLA